MSSLPALLVAAAVVAGAQSDPLPSWSSGTTRSAIVEFVEGVTKPDTPDFVKEADRIAVFDNDGTLWAERAVLLTIYGRHTGEGRGQHRHQPSRVPRGNEVTTLL